MNCNKSLIKFEDTLKEAIRTVFLFFVALYQTFISPHIGSACRFSPSCSEYAKQAIEQHSLLKALGLIFKRLIKCRPFGHFGFDPVPQQGDAKK